MNTFKVLIFFILLLLTTSNVYADDTLGYNLTAARLESDCQQARMVLEESKGDLSVANSCLSYIEGYTAMLSITKQFTNEPPFDSICIPKQVTLGQFIKVFLKYTEGHPEGLHIPKAAILWNSLHDAFPCK